MLNDCMRTSAIVVRLRFSNAEEPHIPRMALMKAHNPPGQQFPSVLVPLHRVFTEVLNELVLVPIVIEEIVTMPVWVFEIGRTLPVSGFQHSLRQLLPIAHHESHVIHPGVKIRLVRPLLGSTSALDA